MKYYQYFANNIVLVLDHNTYKFNLQNLFSPRTNIPLRSTTVLLNSVEISRERYVYFHQSIIDIVHDGRGIVRIRQYRLLNVYWNTMCFENSNIMKENHDDYLCNDLNWSHSIEILLTDLLTYHIVYTFYSKIT